jgi:hypothetical protein
VRLHLDRIRYPGTTVSYDAPSKAAYAETHGGALPTSNSSPVGPISGVRS